MIATDTFARDLGAKFGIGGKGNYGGNLGRDPITGAGVPCNPLVGNCGTIGSGATGNANATRGLNVNLPAGAFTTGSPASLAYTLLGANFNLDLELSAMQQENRGEVLSNPRIITSNQREGYILSLIHISLQP